MSMQLARKILKAAQIRLHRDQLDRDHDRSHHLQTDGLHWPADLRLHGPHAGCIVMYLNAKHRRVFDEDASFEEIPRAGWEDSLDRILSPWPIAIYRAGTALSRRSAGPAPEDAGRRRGAGSRPHEQSR
ncbi:MAG: hypothetical protein H0T75_12285 [Rhizobiales bacterium]|nr:hypothetical protein [Hyphomicrobiales bacterium]MDQ3558428.1 hypothetical protein [Pseudomonadota bacterium]